MDSFPTILVISLFSGVFAQGLKFFLNVKKKGKLNWHDWDNYGGMPSAHAAFLASLCTAIALAEGISSTSFALAVVISAILIRDALGLRMYIEKHGQLLVQIVKKQPQEEKVKNFAKKIGSVRIGHTYLEVTVGVLIGIIIALITYPLF
jgi:uncharacterized protein